MSVREKCYYIVKEDVTELASLDCAGVYAQMKWLIGLAVGNGHAIASEGLEWLELSIGQFHKDHFEWMNERTLQRHLNRLVGEGWLVRDYTRGRTNRWAIPNQRQNVVGERRQNVVSLEAKSNDKMSSEVTTKCRQRDDKMSSERRQNVVSCINKDRARGKTRNKKLDETETSSPSTALGSTFGENRIADLSFENNINNSEDPASPDAPTPPLPPLAPGEELPADWPAGWPRSKADFEQWVVKYSAANGCAVPIGTADAVRTELTRLGATLEDCCRYVIHTLSNMAGEDKGKIRRALVKPQRVREGLRQLREEAAAKEITIDDLSTDPAEVERRQQERKRRQEEEFKRDCEAPISPEDMEYVEEGLKMIEQWNRQKALREELLELDRQRESA